MDTYMAITPLPEPPSRGDSANFAHRGDAFMAALPPFAIEANALQADVTAKQATASAAATTATQKAGVATDAAGAAENSAGVANIKAGEASNSAAAALVSKNAAGTSAGNAAASETAAAASAASVDAKGFATDYAGPAEPPVMWPYMTWADTGNMLLKRRNAAGTAWVVEGYLYMPAIYPKDMPGVNLLINSDLAINQRDVSGTVTLAAGQYGHDRFKAGPSGCTYTPSTVEGVTALSITAGTLQQIVEGINLQSGVHVLSWSGTAQGRIGSGGYGASGITGMVSGGTNTFVEWGIGTLSLVKFEAGSLATPFEPKLIGAELASCQRYFEIISIGAGSAYPTGNANALARTTFAYMVTKRAIPTITIRQNISTENAAASGFLHIDISGGVWSVTSGGAAGNFAASAFFNIDAEL